MASHVSRFIHRAVWQRLPRQFRRAALFRATKIVAPRPSEAVVASLPIIIAGALRTASGLGEGARLAHNALKSAGVPVYGIDLTATLMQPLDFDFEFADGAKLTGAGTLILHVNGPLTPLAMQRIGRSVVRDKTIVGYWAWELPAAPDEWRHGAPFVHQIWAPSNFTANAVKSVAPDTGIKVLPHPVALRRPPPIGRTGRRAFTVLTIFNMASSFARKNPLAAIAAFQTAFGDDASARLIVKASNLDVYPDGAAAVRGAIAGLSNASLIEHTANSDEIDALYSETDVLISLHRSEGFGLTIAEAMLRGIPVVATDWSGNTDFLSRSNGMPIPFRLTPAIDRQGTYDHRGMVWADPDINAAAAALRKLRNDEAARTAIGEAAANFAASNWTAEAFAENVRRLLNL